MRCVICKKEWTEPCGYNVRYDDVKNHDICKSCDPIKFPLCNKCIGA